MTKKELFKSINDLCLELDFEYDINRGGCCFVAAVLAEQLENFNIPYTAYEYDGGRHYAIRVSDRFLNRADFNCCKESMELFDSSDLYRFYYDGDWNRRYSRRWNLIVKTRIKALFRRYENSRT